MYKYRVVWTDTINFDMHVFRASKFSEAERVYRQALENCALIDCYCFECDKNGNWIKILDNRD